MSSAKRIVEALGGRWYGSYGLVRCVAHEDHSPSLVIGDGEKPGVLLVHCYAGCEPRAILKELRRLGHLDGSASPSAAARLERPVSRGDDRDWETRIAPALRIKDRIRTLDGTLGARYLGGRGLVPPFPRVLGFAPALFHAPTKACLPAMVAIVAAPDGSFCGVHRTYLADDPPRKAEVQNPRMALGLISRGAVRLAAASEELAIAEGIETGLAYMQAEGTPTWAALSTSGMRSIVLPPQPIAATVEIIVDADAAGEAAAQHLAERMSAEGRAVRFVRPLAGKDMNDALKAFRDDA